jgi:hypothetical protein
MNGSKTVNVGDLKAHDLRESAGSIATCEPVESN